MKGAAGTVALPTRPYMVSHTGSAAPQNSAFSKTMADGKGKALRALVLLNMVSEARVSFSECGMKIEP